MTITIFMPVIDGAGFVSDAINSVIAQTSNDWRLIVLDGGSQDGTVRIVSHFSDNDSRIKLRVAPDAGQYDAILRGIHDNECDRIGWLNADDLYPPWAIAEAARVFDETGADWLSGLPGLWDESGRLRTVYPLGGRSRRLIAAGWYHDDLLGCLQQESMFFRKCLVDGLSEDERTQILSHPLAGDFALWRSFARQAKLVSVPSVLGGFRRHGRNRSLVSGNKYQEEVAALGGKKLPRWIGRPLRSLHDYAYALVAVRETRAAAYRMAGQD